MKNFEFGKRLNEFRVSQGLSQKDLGVELGVSNKTISKWENAESVPSIAQISELARVFNVTIDELVNKKIKTAKTVKKIVLTGGPCSGKSTAMSWVQTEFTKKGYMVLFVPETATELILGGIAPWTIDNNLDFESYIVKLQLEKEKIFEEASKHIDNYDKVLIVCDRGVMDCKAYMTDLEFRNCLNKINKNEVQLRDNYDAVFHLVSASIGAEEFYNYDTNQARYESLEEAREKDQATLNAWMGHPHLRVVDNSTGFEEKMRRLMAEISGFLGEASPYEIERKYLIEFPDLDFLDGLQNCKKVDIIQTYLNAVDGDEVRIRQRGGDGHYTYTKTRKQKVSDVVRLETESRISKDEYLKLLLDADTTKRQIRKTRYCLMYKNQYFEIDIYPENDKTAIMEIELTKEDQKINFPKFIKIIKEVTGDKEYLNFNLASK